MHDVDTVFHLAANVHALADIGDRSDQYQADNVDGTSDVLAAARRAGVGRVVNFSSVKAMGEGSSNPASEADPARPQTDYGRSKLAAESLVAEAARGGLDTVSLRLPMVYGPGGPGNLSRMMRAMAAGRFPPLPDTGNRRSMVNVLNVVDAACLVATHPRPLGGARYIVADRLDYNTAELQSAMWRVMGRSPPRWRVPYGALRLLAGAGDLAGRLLGRRIGFDSDSLDKLLGSACYRSDRIADELGFAPRHGLEDGLSEMWSAMQSDLPTGSAAEGPDE